MPYLFEGILHGHLCDDCIEPISGVLVRLYAAGPQRIVADQEQGGRALSSGKVEEKRARFLGEGETDAQGGFRVTLSDRMPYQGGAVEVDVYCATVPHLSDDGRQREPVQFTAAIVHPAWSDGDEGMQASWVHAIPARLWCFIRGLFDAWVICGRIVTCDGRLPVPDATVSAWDADWLQDDPLGQATTGADGHFRIDYTSAGFKRTVFSPKINVELTEGPDLYFQVEYAGNVELDEKQPDGRKRGRQNVGHCFCIELCIRVDVPAPGDSPFFSRVGKFNIEHDFHPTGRANKAKGLANEVGGDGWGFFDQITLCGFCPKHHPVSGREMYYRFLYVHPDNPTTEVPITGTSLVTALQIEDRLVPWGSDPAAIQETYVAGAGATPDLPPATPAPAPPAHVIVPDSNGWVKVDQRAPGNGPDKLLRVNTGAIVPGGGVAVAQPGVIDPGEKKNGTLVRFIFEIATDPATPGTIERQTLEGGVYINNWDEAAALYAVQLHEAGGTPCSSLLTELDIRYTLDHELVDSWAIGLSGAAVGSPPSVPNTDPLAQGPTSARPRGNAATINLPLAGWPACSYAASLGSRRKLTNGDVNAEGRTLSQFTFCIRDH